jgi:uncharacterized phage infection (PIP) family protein YhgE
MDPSPSPSSTTSGLVFASANYHEHINMLREMNMPNINEEFNFRNRLYVNNEPLPILPDDDTTSETELDTDISELKEYVNKGRTLLKNELEEYNKIKEVIEDLEENKQQFHDGINKIKKILIMMSSLTSCHEIENYLDSLTDLSKTIDDFDHKINTCLDEKIDTVRQDYKLSVNKLRKLKDVYSTLKQSNSVISCPVCLGGYVDSYLMPCGHTFCSKCLSNINKKCFVCRQSFTKIATLYYN